MGIRESDDHGKREQQQPSHLPRRGWDQPDRLWCVLTGTQTGHKILQSDDAGETWQDWTTGTIASERVVSVAHQRAPTVACMWGQRMRCISAMPPWMIGCCTTRVCPWSTCAPSFKLITAEATFALRNTGRAPSALVRAFLGVGGVHAGSNPIEFGQSLRVTAHSRVCRVGGSLRRATYEWTFEGGQVVDVNGPDAWVDYQEAGTFDVTLTVTDAEGASDTWTWIDLVEVVDEPVVPTEGFQEGFEGGQFLRALAPGNQRTPWSRHTTWLTRTMEAQFSNYWVDTQGAYDLS